MAEELTGAEVIAQERTAAAMAGVAALMARLRGPKGCPWDREQTFDSIKRHTLEETYEVFDAIARRACQQIRDELGHMMLQLVFYAQMASEAGYFTLAEVAEGLSAKLIRRHPHIFGDAVATDAAAVVRTWEQVKAEERRQDLSGEPGVKEQSSALDPVPRAMPAMLEAAKLGSKAARAGFDWPEVDGLFEKLDEERLELQAELAKGDTDGMEAELGDVLFTAVNLARRLHLDPESALRRTNAKFRERYRSMEQLAGGAEALASSSLEQKGRLWDTVKATE